MMNSMQMPQQSQPMQGAGLGAMLQAKGAATGVSKQSMDQMMARARELPDSELADVLAGKSVAVPQFAAMLAAMGRQSLRTAVAGAQAGAAKAPSKKDQMLAAMQPEQAAGLPALPAQNMEQLGEGMADGGIVAFSGADSSFVRPDDDGFTQEELNRLRTDNPNAFQRLMRRMFPGVVDNAAGYTRESTVFTPPLKTTPRTTGPQTEGGALLPYRRTRGMTGEPSPAPAETPLLPPQDLRLLDPNYRDPQQLGGTEDPAGAVVSPGTSDTAPAPGVAPPKSGGPAAGGPAAGGPGGGSPRGGGPGGGLPETDLSRFAREQSELIRPKERNKDYYEALTQPLEDITKQVARGKEQAQGEFLMQIGAALMSTPNVGMALSKGTQAGLPGLAASRKEINALTKDQRDYQFNLAKAKEARDQGDEVLALNYLKLAEESKYHAGMVGAYMARAGSGSVMGPKQYQAARQNAVREVDAYIGKLGPKEKRQALANRDTLIEDAFYKNVQAAQSGPMTSMPDPRVVNEPPKGGNVLSRD